MNEEDESRQGKCEINACKHCFDFLGVMVVPRHKPLTVLSLSEHEITIYIKHDYKTPTLQSQSEA
eukprot:2585854-Rhodomonas_salina.2